MTPAQAQSELARLGYWLSPDLECLGAEKRRGEWFFRFRPLQPSGLTLECGQSDLPGLLAKSAWMNRPEPVFDLAQMSLTDPAAWHQLRRLRRENFQAYCELVGL
ncbi:MAG: hypothetical protein N2Z75_09520 [Meiothermus sp.]|nr:hypothetical protein [Meiothermus sp.]